MKNKICLLLFCLWALFIFSNSWTPATQSDVISGGLSYKLYTLLNLQMDYFTFHVFVRKAAHFIEFFILGLLSIGSFKNMKFSLFICILVACCDETIQLFTEGRSGQISDVMLDSFGSSCSFILLKIKEKLKW